MVDLVAAVEARYALILYFSHRIRVTAPNSSHYEAKFLFMSTGSPTASKDTCQGPFSKLLRGLVDFGFVALHPAIWWIKWVLFRDLVV